MATRRVFRSRHASGAAVRPHSAAQLGVPMELYGDESSTEPSTLLDTGPGSVGPGAIVDGSISPAKFDVTIRPPIYYDGALPPSDSSVASLYIEGALLFWGGTSGNKKLWRHNGTTFVISVDAQDITVNQIVAGQIEVGAIGASHLQVGTTAFAGGNLVKNGSFEDCDSTLAAGYVLDPSATLTRGWTSRGATLAYFSTSVNAKTGTKILAVKSNSVGARPGFNQLVPVIAGRRYRLSGFMWSGGGAEAPWMRANSVSKTGTVVAYQVINLVGGTGSTPVYYEGFYTVPSDGSVTSLSVEVLSYNTAASTSSVFAWEDIALQEVPADVQNTSGEVVIDSSGITINNGKIYLNDEFNNSVLTASGWAGAWADFNAMGLYNAMFSSGATGSIANGRTSNLPYWEVSKGSMTVTRTASSGWPGGAYVRAWWPTSTSGSVGLLSDKVNVVGGMSYSLTALFGTTVTQGYTNVQMNVVWYDGVGGYASELMYWLSSNFTFSIGQTRYESLSFTAPAGAKYARVRVYLYSTAGATSNYIDIGSVGFHLAPPALDFDGSHDVDFLTVQQLTVGSIPTFNDNVFQTWTPAIGGDGSPSYSARTGWYMKIGKMVFCSGYVVWSTNGSGSGEITVTTPTSPWRGARQTLNASIESFTGHSNGPASILTFTSGSGATWDRVRASGGNIIGSQATAPAYLVFNGWYREA